MVKIKTNRPDQGEGRGAPLPLIDIILPKKGEKNNGENPEVGCDRYLHWRDFTDHSHDAHDHQHDLKEAGMPTEAKKRYRREKVQTVRIDLYGTDEDIKAHLEAMKERGESVQKYIKDLIRADMR
nr:MAG TPA: NikA, BACTERIAL CONJUGATION, RELAXASE, DNA [Caudoviricetes sp.]